MGDKDGNRSRSPLPASPSVGRASSKKGGGPPGLDNNIKATVADMGSDLTTSIMAQVTAAQNVMAAGIIGAIEPRLVSLQERLEETIHTHEARFETIEDQVSSLAELHAKQDHQLADMQDLIKDLQRRLGAAESVVPNAAARIISDDIFSHPPNKSILHLECQDIVTLDSAKETVASWLDDLHLDAGAYKLKGRDADRKFVIQFTGEMELAALRAHKALLLLRGDGGEWRKLVCSTPGGVESRVYINVDKNHKQKRTEMGVRDLSRLMVTELPTCKFTANKAAGLLYCNHMPLAEIKCPDPDTIEVWWNNTSAAKIPKFDRNDIKARLTKTKTSSDQWSL